MIEAEGLGISQYHVLPWALADILQKNSLSDGNDCVICSDTVPSLLEIRILELKRSNSTERSSKWVVSPGQRTVPAQLCVSGLSAHPNSPGFGLHSYISGKYPQNHGQSWFLKKRQGEQGSEHLSVTCSLSAERQDTCLIFQVRTCGVQMPHLLFLRSYR